jgi:hypothetical protein
VNEADLMLVQMGKERYEVTIGGFEVCWVLERGKDEWLMSN